MEIGRMEEEEKVCTEELFWVVARLCNPCPHALQDSDGDPMAREKIKTIGHQKPCNELP
jgi:hypothetical protein